VYETNIYSNLSDVMIGMVLQPVLKGSLRETSKENHLLPKSDLLCRSGKEATHKLRGLGFEFFAACVHISGEKTRESYRAPANLKYSLITFWLLHFTILYRLVTPSIPKESVTIE
jgi:hypothetical protein